MFRNNRRGGREWLALPAALLFASLGHAAGKVATVAAPGEGPKVIAREAPDKPYHLTKDGDGLNAGSQVIGGLGTTIHSANGGVTARLMADYGGHSPYPILETSLVLKEPGSADLAFQFERGRVDIENSKKEGAVTVAITVRDKTGTITLPKPGDRVVIEMYSRWARGTRFTKTPTEKDVPAMALLFIAVKGDIELKSADATLNLKSPPGPAMVWLDSLTDMTPQIESLEKVPAWVNEKDAEVLLKIRGSMKQFREEAEKKSIPEALVTMAMSDNESARGTAVILLGAMDELEQLGRAMQMAKHQDVIDQGIIVLRNWIGRGPGQDLKLYNLLIEKGMFRPAEAEMALQLLHSFSSEDLRHPATYQALIHFLDAERPLIRALAHWHLIRLVPGGREIGYKAIFGKEDREKYIKKWEELVPPGTIPGAKK